MRTTFERIYYMLIMFGIDPLKMIRSIRGVPIYCNNFVKLNKQKKKTQRPFRFGKPYPCLSDRSSDSGTASGHYFHQDLLVARRIYINNPSLHVDVGSRVDGFVAHVASFRPIKVVDIRPLQDDLTNIEFIQADMMSPLKPELVGYSDSVSCLHVLEHFGLGRYGDPVNYDGYLLGLENLGLMLKKGGKLYFSVPIGPQRIEFDSHRVFSVEYLLELFSEKYQIDEFSFVDDAGALHESIPITELNKQTDFGCWYGCGILEMTKL